MVYKFQDPPLGVCRCLSIASFSDDSGVSQNHQANGAGPGWFVYLVVLSSFLSWR